MGNTGNARTTPPHLHFGIYTSSGAIDPFPFINPKITAAPEILASATSLDASMRTISKTTLQSLNFEELPVGTLVQLRSATENKYRIKLPDGRLGYILAKQLSPTTKPLKNLSIDARQVDMFENPDSLSAIKTTLKKGSKVSVLGYFADFQFAEFENNLTGWIRK